MALTFLDKVRRFKGRHPSVGDVHDTVFTNEFSAAFLEETAILMAEGGGDSVVDGSQRQEQRSTGRETRTRGRWWNNIFKWPKLSRGRSTEAQSQRTRPVVMEGVLQMLNLADPMQVTTWQCCKLCLLEEQGNYQLEVFTPPKVSRGEGGRERSRGRGGGGGTWLMIYTAVCTAICYLACPLCVRQQCRECQCQCMHACLEMCPCWDCLCHSHSGGILGRYSNQSVVNWCNCQVNTPKQIHELWPVLHLMNNRCSED